MPHFSVMLHGKGVEVPPIDGGAVPMIGFFTTRAVTARDADDACRSASEKVLAEWTKGRFAASNRGSMPTLSVERVVEVSLFSRWLRHSTSYIFYANDSDDEGDTLSAA